MLRSLVWKEWREQRAVAIVGVLLALGLPVMLAVSLTLSGREDRLGDLATILPLVSWILLWPLAAIATSATMITSDTGDGRLAFLLSRPVPRHLVLGVKIGVAVAVTLTIVAAGQVVAHAAGGLFPVAPELADALGFGPLDQAVRRGVMAASALAFALATLLSLVAGRALLLAGVSALVALVVVVLNVSVWALTDYAPQVGGPTTWPPLLLAGGLLAACFPGFARGELLRGRTHVVRVVALLIAAASLWTGGVAAAAAWKMRPPSGSVIVSGVAAGPDRATVAITVARPDRAASRSVALVGQDGSFELIGARLTEQPAVSPDGRRIAYLGHAGAAGFRTGSSLRMWDRETGTERVLARGRTLTLRPPAAPVFSPDGRYVSAALREDTVIAAVAGDGPARTVGCRDHSRVLGWDAMDGSLVRRCGARFDWIDPVAGVIDRSVTNDAEESLTPITSGDPGAPTVVAWQVHRRGPENSWDAYTVRLPSHGAEYALLQGEPVDRQTHVDAVAVASAAGGESPRIAYVVRRRGSDHSVASQLEIRLLDPSSGQDRRVDLREGYHDVVLTFRDETNELVAITRQLSFTTATLPGDIRAYDLTTDAHRDMAVLDPGVSLFDTKLAGGGLVYLARPMVVSRGGVKTLDELYLAGWHRAIRAIDLATGEDSLVFDGGVE